MNKNNLIAGFFRYHREKLNYSQRGLINDSSPVKESSLCDFENGKRTLNEEQLVYLFQQIGYDYYDVINRYSFSNEFSKIMNFIYLADFDDAIDLFKECKEKGVFDSLGALKFAVLDYLFKILYRENLLVDQDIILSCANLMSTELYNVLRIAQGILLKYKGNNKESIICFKEVLNSSYDENVRAWSFSQIGTAYDSDGDYYNAQKYTEEALSIYSRTMNFKKMIQLNLTLGTICMHIDACEHAEDSYKKAYESSLELKDFYKVTTRCFENICWLYFITNQYNKFEQFTTEEIGNLVLNENTYFVLAWAYYKTGRVEECVKYCKEAREKYKDREYPQIVFTYIERAVLGKKSGQDTLLKKAITMEDYEHNKEIDELFTLELIDIYERRKNYEKAYKYTRKLLNR
ncbi:MAG: hypothetical protein J6K75_02110 [Erysipelotrichaceae bacterium]|nr:hypothetical protein [Erysipelotrichaceae bacterium]